MLIRPWRDALGATPGRVRLASGGALGGALASALLRCALAAGGLGLAVVLLRVLGPERAGHFFLAYSVVTIGSTIGQAGMNNLLARRLARAQALRVQQAGAATYAAALRTALAASLGVAAVLELGSRWLAEGFFGDAELVRPLRILTLAVPPLAVVLVGGEALKGLGRPLSSQLFQVGLVPLVALVLLPCVTPRFGAAGAAGAYALAALVAAVASVCVVRRLLPARALGAQGPALAAEPGAARSMLVFALTGVLAVRLGPLLAGALHSSRAVAELEVGLRLVLIANLVLNGINSAMAPRFAALHAQGRYAELARAARASARLGCALVLPYLAAVFALRGPLLGLFELELPVTLLLALAAGEAVNALTGPATLVLLMGGGERWVRNTAVAATLLNAALCVALVPSLGALGAALGASAGSVLLNCASVLGCRRLFGMSTLPVGGALGTAQEATA